MLHYIEHGSGTSVPPIIIAHGLFGSARNWNVIARRLSDRGRVITPDMRNHGQSPRADTQSYADMANDLAELIDHIGGPVDLVGHSMGGKAAMTLAISAPKKLRRLVVADIAPVAYAHTQSHQIDAMRAVDLTTVTRRSEAAAQLGAAGVPEELQSFFTQSLDLEARAWRLNLETLDAEMPKIVGFPDLTGSFDGPTLFLGGGDSDYITPDARPRITELFPNARFAKLPGAGHWLHAEKPREFEAALRVFLDA